MLKLRVVQALKGDCMILVNDTGAQRRYILVDGGPKEVYGAYLRGELEKLAAQGGRLDLVVLTHVDDDHVAGLLEMMAEMKKAREGNTAPVIQVGGMWHNGFSQILPEEPAAAEELEETMLNTSFSAQEEPDQDAASTGDGEPAAESAEAQLWGMPVPDFNVNQGYLLQVRDTELGIPRNEGFANGLVQAETAARPLSAAGMNLWILGPSQANLEKMREKWFKDLKPQAISFGVPTLKPDTSITNLSSIMFLAESEGRRILMTGDGRSDDVVSGLEQAGLLAPGGTLHLDILKLPHHGSARNNVGQLFDRVLADTYVISADGHNGNPDRKTLDWLVDAACSQNRDITIVATNTTVTLEKFQVDRPPEQNHYRLVIRPADANAIEL